MNQLSPYKILYVDDEPMSLKYFVQALEGKYEVITASSADEGLAKLQRHSREVAVLITDQRMPGKMGMELLKQAKAYYPNVVRILTTAYSDVNSAIQAMNQGAVYQYINKPWDLEDLLAVIRRAMQFFMLKRERDLLAREKLSSIQRMALISKVQSLLIFASTRADSLCNPRSAVDAYVASVRVDPGVVVDFQKYFGRQTGRFDNQMKNLTLVEQLISGSLGDIEREEGPLHAIKLIESLSRIREDFPQIIYSVRLSGSDNGDAPLRPRCKMLHESLRRMLELWLASSSEKKIIEVSEKTIEGGKDTGESIFRIKCGLVSDNTDYDPVRDDKTLFNGSNLDEEMDMAWINLLFMVAHTGGRVETDWLTRERFQFFLKYPAEGKAPKKDVTSEAVMDRLFAQFEKWNLAEQDA
ncbi:MAG: response regulator [Opitutales bacterium]|nr:response regulator [Opitutales bacterium]